MYYFIVNPNSRCGRGRNIWKKVERMLKASYTEYQAFFTEKPGDARRFARELTEGCRDSSVIIGVGGDGTVNEILDGLSFCGSITLGYIPAGSGNDLARSLKLPKNPVRCLKKILHPKYYKLMDYGVTSWLESDSLFLPSLQRDIFSLMGCRKLSSAMLILYPSTFTLTKAGGLNSPRMQVLKTGSCVSVL